MNVFAYYYPYLVLTIGSIAALGVLLAGFACAFVFITGRGETNEVTSRAITGTFAITVGCGACIICLAFTKWILGL